MKGSLARSWLPILVLIAMSLLVGRSMADQVIPAEPVPGSTTITEPTPDPSALPEGSTPSTPVDSNASAGSSNLAGTGSADLSGASPLGSPSDASAPLAVELDPSASVIPGKEILIRAPRYVRVDPRAASTLLPRIHVESDATLLACLSSQDLLFDIGLHNHMDGPDTETVTGDLTGEVMVAGSGPELMQLLNGEHGMRVNSRKGSVVGDEILLKVIAISQRTIEPSLCRSSVISENRTIAVFPLGIDLDMKKADVRLVKRATTGGK